MSMLKLMKYEFRKMRTMLIILLAVLFVLEGGFLLGSMNKDEDIQATCLLLLIILAVVTYIYVMIAGIVSYSRELKDRTGYLVFMAPVRPMGIVASKLLTTVLAAVGFGALFGLCAGLDFKYLMDFFGYDRATWAEMSIAFRVAFAEEGITLTQLVLTAVSSIAEMFVSMIATMCAAYLAITLSATVMQKRKSFLRGLVSFLLFCLITTLMSEFSNRFLLPDRAVDVDAAIQMLGFSVLFYVCASAVFAWASAALLKRRVSL